MKTRRQQRRSSVAFIGWGGVLIGAVATVVWLVDPAGTPSDRVSGIVALAVTIALAYVLGRWREL